MQERKRSFVYRDQLTTEHFPEDMTSFVCEQLLALTLLLKLNLQVELIGRIKSLRLVA